MASPFIDEVGPERIKGKRVLLDRERSPPAGPQEAKAKPAATGEGVDECRTVAISLHARPQFAPRFVELEGYRRASPAATTRLASLSATIQARLP